MSQVVAKAYPQKFEYRAIQEAPRECGILRETLLELSGQLYKLLHVVARSQDIANKTYHTQLKKMREVCNESIRNAIQVFK